MTVVADYAPGSGPMCDALSTALFLMPQDEGQTLLTRYNAEAMWVDADGGEFFSPGFRALLRT